MDTRKIQKVGGSTYTVSVPKGWASENDIQAGSEVCLYTHIDGSLVIRDRPEDGTALSRARLDVDGDRPETVARALAAAYAAGFETAELRAAESFTDDQHRAVADVTRRLVGMEVLETGDDRITVRTLLDAGEVSVRQSVVQAKFVALSMHHTATAALVGEQSAPPDHLTDRDDEVDRLFGMVARHCNRSLTDLGAVDDLGIERRELFEYRAACRQLERVADHAVEVARVADRLRERPPEDLAGAFREVGNDARTVVDDATAVLFADAAVERAHAALDLHDDLQGRVGDVETTLRDRAGVDPLLMRALCVLERTAANGANVAETAIQAAARDRPRDDAAPTE